MTRLRVCIGLAALLLGAPVVTLAQSVAYTTKTVNLRAGPDRAYPLVLRSAAAPTAPAELEPAAAADPTAATTASAAADPTAAAAASDRPTAATEAAAASAHDEADAGARRGRAPTRRRTAPWRWTAAPAAPTGERTVRDAQRTADQRTRALIPQRPTLRRAAARCRGVFSPWQIRGPCRISTTPHRARANLS
jgi:hypothetical protein